jgi:hypothetical protein
MQGDTKGLGLDSEQVEIEKRVEIRAKQKTIDCCVVGNPTVRGYVSGLYDVEKLAAANHALRAISAGELPTECALASTKANRAIHNLALVSVSGNLILARADLRRRGVAR